MDYAERRIRLRKQLSADKIDLVAISPGPDMFYLMGFHPLPDERPCYLLLTENKEELLVPELNVSQTEVHVQLPITSYSDNDGAVNALRNLTNRLGVSKARTILVNGSMRSDFALLLQEQMATTKLGTATNILGQMRMRKDVEEIGALQANAAQADVAMKAGWVTLKEGMAELDIAREVEGAFSEQGAERTNFAIIGAGPNSAFPHHSSGKQRMQQGDAVVMDIGALAFTYNSDLTRMAYLGDFSDEYAKVHEIVEVAVTRACSVAKPGVPAGRVDDAARDVITEAGYGDFFTHRTGHGIGLEVHEPPYITATNEIPLEQGMTFSIEPGIYIPGKFGVRLEEIVVVTDSGVQVLSSLSRDVYQVAIA